MCKTMELGTITQGPKRGAFSSLWFVQFPNGKRPFRTEKEAQEMSQWVKEVWGPNKTR